MSGQICTFFQQGRCKYGDRCRNIHPTGSRFRGSEGAFGGNNNSSFANNNSFGALSGNSGGGGFGGSGFGGSGGGGFGQQGFGSNAGFGNNSSNTNRGSAFGSTGANTAGAKKIAFDANTILNDITNDRPLHELSSYGPGKEEPNLIPGKDMQPEELRLMYYEAQNPALPQVTGDYLGLMAAASAAGSGPAGMQNAFMQKLQQLNMSMNQEIQKIAKDTQGAYQYFMNTIRSSGGALSPTSSTTAGAPGNSSFGGATSAFGQNSSFGQSSALGQGAAFGQPSTLGQNSTFGQISSLGQASAFGQPSTLGATSAFGQTSVLGAGQSAFAAAGNPAGAFGAGGSGNTFGSGSAFGTASGQSAFGTAPAQSAFGTGGNVFGAQLTPQTAVSAFGAGAGFGQQSAFGNSSVLTGSASTAGTPFGSGFSGGTQSSAPPQQQPQSAFGSTAFANAANPNPFGQSGNDIVNGFGGGQNNKGSGVSDISTASKDAAVSAGTLKMVQATGLKSSLKGEPLTEEEIAAYRASTFEIKRIPEQEPPLELR
ncbi:hypothetical protein EDD11_002123 [Mortierella claussenii]|nr:hypothetical protein EDD11_002123 [Mortierella claussenii]